MKRIETYTEVKISPTTYQEGEVMKMCAEASRNPENRARRNLIDGMTHKEPSAEAVASNERCSKGPCLLAV